MLKISRSLSVHAIAVRVHIVPNKPDGILSIELLLETLAIPGLWRRAAHCV